MSEVAQMKFTTLSQPPHRGASPTTSFLNTRKSKRIAAAPRRVTNPQHFSLELTIHKYKIEINTIRDIHRMKILGKDLKILGKDLKMIKSLIH